MTVIKCGLTHLHPLAEQITQAVRASEGFKQGGGCGCDFDMDVLIQATAMYRCVECGRWLCKPCILRHFAETSDHVSAGEKAQVASCPPRCLRTPTVPDGLLLPEQSRSDAMSEPLPLLLKFVTDDRRSPTGTGRWTPNRWRSVRGELVACENGLHATTADNLLPFLNAQLWRVEIDGEHLWDTDSSMGCKLVARRMRITERIDAWNDRTARLFAADCAERVLPLFERERPGDARPREAIAVARRFANGEATQDELAAAVAAAVDAAGAAAVDAAVDAAVNAAVAAAGASSSCVAARAAAWAAAGHAAGDAARAAAWDAERAWQSRRLAAMLGLDVAP